MPVLVPVLEGLTEVNAKAALDAAGLRIGNRTEAQNVTVIAGSISRATPPAGTSVDPGSAVDLEVSTGPAPAAATPPIQVSVPDVFGKTQLAAEAALKSAGLTLGSVTRVRSHEMPAGAITTTNPLPGTLVASGSKVDLEISTGISIDWVSLIPTAIFGSLGIVSMILIGVGLWNSSFLQSIGNTEIARGLITFLIAVTVVVTMIILVIANIISNEVDQDAADKRFRRGNQLFTALIGILGTIIGFYFGSDHRADQRISAPVITSAVLPDGMANGDYSESITIVGGKPPMKWTVSPALPKGLTLDPQNGKISGKTTQPFPKTVYKFTVADSSIPPLSSSQDLSLEFK